MAPSGLRRGAGGASLRSVRAVGEDARAADRAGNSLRAVGEDVRTMRTADSARLHLRAMRAVGATSASVRHRRTSRERPWSVTPASCERWVLLMSPPCRTVFVSTSPRRVRKARVGAVHRLVSVFSFEPPSFLPRPRCHSIGHFKQAFCFWNASSDPLCRQPTSCKRFLSKNQTALLQN